MTKSQKTIRNSILAGALALSAAGMSVLASPAASSPSYDGLWSVVIVTERGTCDRAYRYPIRISRGSVVNVGESPATITGRVGGNGAVTVTVSHGNQRAHGQGRLNSNNGSGSWTGGECSGRWEAERRGGA